MTFKADSSMIQALRYTTPCGITVERQQISNPYEQGVAALCSRLDTQRGVVLTSGFEFPGRYSRFAMGFADPPLQLTSRGRKFALEALNGRGAVLLGGLLPALRAADHLVIEQVSENRITGAVKTATGDFSEEERSKQPSVFSLIRCLRDALASPQDHELGLYGAFSYDLVFQFETLEKKLPRAEDQRDLVLFMPDDIITVDHISRTATRHLYDFSIDGRSTEGLPRETDAAPLPEPRTDVEAGSDHAPGEYAQGVKKARAAFHCGDLFEAVLSQTFTEPMHGSASALFERLSRSNPSPYGALMNLGDGEALVAASPEMYVRAEGRRIETCPIAGTIARGRDALEDAEQIRALLNSEKEAAELTMCTDVDRNDKSRICVPGTVQVIGRRQLEMYSRLIHTVDHVEGILADGYDALDAFLTHMWAVTVTGAPKAWAMQFIEEHEKSPRRWYGGAIGRITFDGDMNTGLTLRTVRLADGVAEVRAGATLLYDSEPEAEDAECRLKASALFAAIRGGKTGSATEPAQPRKATQRVLLIDHEDSFVHTLGGYLRQLGCVVTTLRSGAARAALSAGEKPDLVFLSPGPGEPSDFDTAATLKLIEKAGLPAYGVCLGLQAMIEYGGGTLSTLEYPMHGKPTEIARLGGDSVAGLPERFIVGRYHSLFARENDVPGNYRVTAVTDDGVVMGIEDPAKRWAAVQFHPESILTSPEGIGLPLLYGALAALCPKQGDTP